MNLTYDGKRTEKEILLQTSPAAFETFWNDQPSKLIHGENLNVLKYLLAERNLGGKIDLVYIDPPFATRRKFKSGKNRISTISSSGTDDLAYTDDLCGADFLEFLRERLIFIRELMAENASIYLHTDYKIGHYVKIIMDEIFGAVNFRNDITRIKCNPKNFKRKAYGNIKDLLLFYSKGKDPTWNEPQDDFSDEDIERLFKKTDADGRLYTTIPLHAPGETKNGKTGAKWRGISPPTGRHWRSAPDVLEQLDADGLIEWSANKVPRRKIFADERTGKKKQDIWDHKDAQYPNYPTEKNAEMLRSIIDASSNEGDLVLDCFCGSGTTLLAADEARRNWIGIDESPEAIRSSIAKLDTDSNFQILEQRNVNVKTHGA